MSKIDPSQLTKLYYSIGEVADMFDVNTSLIRFWEKEFPQIKPKKNKKGNRLYTVKDITKVNDVYKLVKEQGFTLEGAKKAIKSGVTPEPSEESTPKNNEELIHRLETIKMRLLALKQ